MLQLKDLDVGQQFCQLRFSRLYNTGAVFDQNTPYDRLMTAVGACPQVLWTRCHISTRAFQITKKYPPLLRDVKSLSI